MKITGALGSAKSRGTKRVRRARRDERGNKNMGHWHRRAAWRGAGRDGMGWEGEVFGSQMTWTRRRPPL